LAKVIAVANQKGGMGKTTTAVNLSSCFALSEKKTLLVDCDPQGNATSGLGIDKGNLKISIYDVLINEVPAEDAVLKTEVPYLEILPSNINLVGAEIELVNIPDREKRLKSKLEPLKNLYDFILLDAPPSLGLLTINLLSAADSVLIPIQCEYYALEGLGQLLNTISLVKKNINSKIEIEGVLLTMFDSRLNLSKQVAEEVEKYFGDKIFKTMVKRNVRLSEAPSFGKPIILYDINSTGAQSYINLAKEILDHGKASIG